MLLLAVTVSTPLPPEDFGFRGFTAVFAVSYAVVGRIVTVRQPRNAVGWIFLGAGLLTSLMVFSQGYTIYGYLAHPGALPLTSWAAWLYGWLWLPFVALVAIFAILLFPDGRLLGPRWAAVAWLGGAAAGPASLFLALQPGPLSNFTMIRNPAGVEFLASWFAVGVLVIGLVSVAAGASALSLILRFRRSQGVERQQLRWIAYAGAVVAFLLALASALVGVPGFVPKATQVLLVFAIAGVPVAAGVAMLRYRLYDLDLIINRTVVYGSVTAILALAFGAADIGLQRLVETVTGERSDLVSGTLGVAAAVAFGPMRRAARPVVNRLLPNRAQLALVFSDVVESTARIVELGDERWHALLDRYHATVRQELARNRGHEVDMAGDGFFAYFERPIDAIACAWTLRTGVRELGLEIRTGIHHGECQIRGEDVTGLSVHTAARVMAAAGAGEILGSLAVLDAVGDVVEAVDRGEHALKGVPGTWQLFALEPIQGREPKPTDAAPDSEAGSRR